jgi:hypothetical protein
MKNRFDEFLSDKRKTKERYHISRVSGKKLATVVDFITINLQPRPAQMRNKRIKDYLFKNVPVFDRGGLSIKCLFSIYKQHTYNQERVGFPTFNNIIHLLTSKGETKAGLSTYYVDFRHYNQIVNSMLTRLEKLELEQQKINDLKNRWNYLFIFCKFDYCKEHLCEDSNHISHCMTCALGEDCNKIHGNNEICVQCLELFKLPIDILNMFQTIRK